MIHLTDNLRNYLIQDRQVGLVFTKILNFINECAEYLSIIEPKDSEEEMLKEFSVWYVKPLEEANAIVVYAIADTNKPIEFTKNFQGYVPETKLYLASNGECGYTLMLPEDY